MVSKDTKNTLSYQKLLNRISKLAWIIKYSGQILQVNTAWQNYTGRSLHASEADFIWDLMPLTEQKKIKQQWHDSFSSSLWQCQLQLQNAQGDYNLVDFELEQLTLDETNPLWIGTASVINTLELAPTESELADYRQHEIKLQRNVELVRRIMENSQDCIKVLDLQGRLLYMNDGGQNILEIDDFSQVQYSLWLNCWHGSDRQAAEQAFATAKTGKVSRFDGYCATAKGTPKWWEVIVTPMFDEDNRVQDILSVSRDISIKKIAEQALEQRNQELDRFTYMVSHDLKAPLRGISNLADWIAEDLGDRIPDETKKHLNLMGQRVQRMDALIDGLLKFSKAGRQQLPTESINLVDLFKDIIDSLSPPAGFKITYPESLPDLTTKRVLLTQVLSNLISNAIKHHDRDTGQIEITVKDGDTYVEFAIADDGSGIEESLRERAFKMFQTLQSKTSTNNTGIGLALVKKIVLAEGGKVWLEENYPRGCKFCFTWNKSAAT